MAGSLHIFAVSDSVGETAEKIAVASALQYQVERQITRFSRVIKESQVTEILNKAREEDAIVIYTIVKSSLANFLDSEATKMGVQTVNAMAPLFDAITAKTGLEPAGKIGLTHTMDDEYFSRMKAIEYTIDHDNGQNVETFKDADLIILGMPRTSKTPLAMHMANLGIKVANYPINLNTEIPGEIMALKGTIPMVGLTIDVETLIDMRRDKAKVLDLHHDLETLQDMVAEELDNAYSIYAKLKCLGIDVTLDDIEEIASAITYKCALPPKVSHVRFK